MPDENSSHVPNSVFTVLLSIWIVLMFSGITGSQDLSPVAQNFHQWGSVTLFNGLPSDNVRAISQTPDGVLWFGTDNGLARFDGRRVETIAIPDADSNKILSLELAADGSLWIGTENGAIRYADNRFEKIEGTGELSVTAILPGENMLLATASGLLLKVKTNEDGSFAVEMAAAEITESSGQTVKITSLVRHGGRVFAGTGGRSLLLLDDSSLVEASGRSRPYFVNALAGDSSGNVWAGADVAGSGSGLFSLDDVGRPERIGEMTGDVLSVEPDGRGGVWAGTEKSGLFLFRESREINHFTFENTSGSLRSNTIYSIFVDRESVVWIGTNRGVSRFDSSSPFLQSISDSPNSNFVRTLYRTRDGRILAGTNRGLFANDGKTWKELPGFEQKAIYAIGEDSDGSFLAGTAAGILDSSGKLISEGDTRAIANFQGWTFAAVFGRGVVEIVEEKQSNLIFSEGSPTTLFSGAGKLFIGTAKLGVFSFDGTKTERFIAPDLLDGGAIWKIAIEGDGFLLAGERGLFRSKNEKIEKIIAGHDVRDVVVNGADIWAATSSGGLLHARRDEMFGWLVSNISVEEGLPSEKTFTLLPLGNSLLIGTNRGVVTYIPGAVHPKLIPVRILSRRLHDAEELRSTITLEYPQNSLLVEVAGQSSRTFPEDFQYAFVLKNAAGDIGGKQISPSAQFAPGNLAPGDYHIEARVFNRDLLPSEPLAIRFSVARAPFPRTAAALGVLLAIALVALVWAVIERRRIALRNRELAAARFDLANEAERERHRIARDLHDQTLADLRNLMMMSDRLSPDNAEFRAEIESVSSEIRRICEDLSPSVLQNVGLVAALEFLLSHTAENYTFRAVENIEERIKFPINVQLQIYRITQEVLTNIKRHSNAKMVEMKTDVTANGEFVLTIDDDGEPFDASQAVVRGRGITNIRSRAALIDADITWLTNEKGGTTFRLRKKAVD